MKMEHPKKITPPSSPTLSPSGNNENLRESRRISDKQSKKQQQFMAPAMSTASKILATPKNKKILGEWKPPKMGNTTPIKSMGKFSEDETSVNEFTIPYDPLTNYLSPRPKFLRYNPNRKRKIMLRREAERGCRSCSSNSSNMTGSQRRFSLESMSSCNANDRERNLEEEVEAEEVIEECGMGWKRVLLNWVVVFSGLVLSTVYISSMNNNSPMNNSPVIYPEKFEFSDLGNMSLGMVSLRGSWVFAEREESVMGVSEKFDAKSVISGVIDGNQVPTIPEEEVFEFNYAIDYAEKFKDYQRRRDALKKRDYDDELEETKKGTEARIAAESKAVLDEVKSLVLDAPVAVPDPNLVTREETLVDFDVRIPDLVSVVETVAEVPEAKIKNVELENEVNNLVFDGLIAVHDSANVVDIVAEAPEAEIMGVESENEVKNLADNPESDGIREVNIFEVDDKEVRLPQITYIWLVGLTVMGYVACMVACLSRKCKRVFTRGGSSRRRLNPQAGREEHTRLEGLPPRLGVDKIHQTSDYIMNTTFVSEVVVSSEHRQVPTPGRILSMRPLGEVEFGGGFSGAIGRGKVQAREESVFAVPDERSAKRSKVSPDSTSKCGRQEDGKEGRTGPRRSERHRLRSLGIAST